MTLAEIEVRYGGFGVYIDTMREECTQVVGRPPNAMWVEDDDPDNMRPATKRIMLSFEWERAR